MESAAEAHTAAVFRKYEMVDIMPLRYDVSLHGLDLVYVARLIAQISSNFGEFRRDGADGPVEAGLVPAGYGQANSAIKSLECQPKYGHVHTQRVK